MFLDFHFLNSRALEDIVSILHSINVSIVFYSIFGAVYRIKGKEYKIITINKDKELKGNVEKH